MTQCNPCFGKSYKFCILTYLVSVHCLVKTFFLFIFSYFMRIRKTGDRLDQNTHVTSFFLMEKSDCSTETPVSYQVFLHLSDFQQEGGFLRGLVRGGLSRGWGGCFSSWDLPLPESASSGRLSRL